MEKQGAYLPILGILNRLYTHIVGLKFLTAIKLQKLAHIFSSLHSHLYYLLIVFLEKERLSYDNQKNEQNQDSCHIIAETTIAYFVTHPTLPPKIKIHGILCFSQDLVKAKFSRANIDFNFHTILKNAARQKDPAST
ncbi:hypothetical protein [Paenibacillus sp. XY044]|uniref:hypothetical protein n=1 Tax=Paenibacillus sp. XY044 TaxID=2026089 RepID=UPI000B98130D|nr:hypothetical protein [Paenibacillus sp. XY044]OZB96509.1 hypothetical protein CJP46_11525 [Paenibacillus sp. XY044]